MLQVISLESRMLPPLVLLMILVVLLLYVSSMKPKGYPPGPRWLPILGSALEVARLRKETGYLYKTCTQLSKKYGPVVGLKIGVDRIVILNNYESMRSMLTNEDCDGRPTGPVYEARTWGKRRGVLVTDGNLWVQQRRFLLRHLRELGLGKNDMATMIEEEALHLMNNFLSRLENSVFLRNHATNNNDNGVAKNGKIYQLTEEVALGKRRKFFDSSASDSVDERRRNTGETKSLKIEDMYVKAGDYDDVIKASQSTEMVIQMDEVFGVPILNTLWRMMAGKRYNQEDKELLNLQRILASLLKECDMIGAMFGHFPVLRYLAPELSGYKKFMECHRELWRFLETELAIHKQKFDANAPRDLMEAYLKILQSENLNETFSEKQLLAVCVDLFMAGSETTTHALKFCFLYLTLYPEVQRKAQEEIDREIGRDRTPTLADRPRMTYVNAIALESVRLFMGRTMNIPHRALKDTYIMGHRIPKNTMIVANFNRVLMDESWGDPEVFRPERFIDDKGNICVSDQYLPFSTGKHHCMGEGLAKSNIFVFTAVLLQTFTFSPVPGEEKPTIAFTDGVTAGPLPFRVLVSKRS